MQDIHDQPLSAEETEAIDAMGAELEAVSDEVVAEEVAKDEMKQDTVTGEIADALAAAVSKQEEYLNMAQRVQADFDNFRRRNQNVRKESFDDGTRAFATTLLPVIDNFERAISAATDSSDTALKEGVQMVHRQLCDAFEKRGITTIDRKGEAFDPNLENAVMQGSADDGEPGTVCEVFQKGYQMEGVVLRHAMVKVVPE
ncbi:MAG: nucleotide exchange factor GrpE [Clostridiales bacterium]|nr:nucleotide exchange factor GrpE [Clostridiales bacterium]